MRAISGRLFRLQSVAALAITYLMVSTAEGQQQQEVLEYRGTVAPAIEGEVAPQLDGLVTAIKFAPGQFVEKGDLLFEFAARDKEIALALVQARSKQAEAELRLAEVNLKNAKTLQTRQVATEMQLLEAEAHRDMAAGRAEEARANVELADLALQQMKLYAPISGIISRPLARQGTFITREAREQSSLATIVQLDPIHVIGRVPAASYVSRGDHPASIEQADFGLVLPDGDKYPYKGRLIAGGYELDPATQTVEVAVEFPNPDLLLRPGLDVTLQSFVRAKIE